MNIRVHIERLVIEGLPLQDGDTRRVRDVLVAELERLFAGHVLLPGRQQGFAVARVEAPALSLEAGSGSADVARQLARSIHRAVAPTAPRDGQRPTDHSLSGVHPR
jgi:hypothetical protein